MLSIISSPIGNLKDISYRSIEALKCASIVYCEDTRVTKKLLNHYSIKNKQLFPYNDHNEKEVLKEIIEKLEHDENIILISDAGTPLISDPGFPLIRECIKRDIDFVVLPGPTAIIPSLIYSGFPVDKFSFYGFIPRSINKQQELAKTIITSKTSIVCFENVKRLQKTLINMNEVFDKNIQVVICREITKKFEKIYRGDISSIIDQIENNTLKIKGEIVIVFYAKNATAIKDNEKLINEIGESFLKYLSKRDASKLISELYDIDRSETYKFLVDISKKHI